MRCELGNDLGRWVVQATPGTVVVRTSAQPLTVSCGSAAAGQVTARLLSSRTKPQGDAAVAGAVIGGGTAAAVAAPALALGGPFGLLAATLVVIGSAAGAGVAHAADAASQAFSYPTVVTIAMACPVAAQADSAPATR